MNFLEKLTYLTINLMSLLLLLGGGLIFISSECCARDTFFSLGSYSTQNQQTKAYQQAKAVVRKAERTAQETYNFIKHRSNEILGKEVNQEYLKSAYHPLEILGRAVISSDNNVVGYIEDILVREDGKNILIISDKLSPNNMEPRHMLFMKDGSLTSTANFQLNITNIEFQDRPTVKVTS
jgi:hypothetical protein